MDMHKVPLIQDYWSSDPILQVPYIAKIKSLKRFEELRAYVHFNDNEKMTSKDDKNHDRALKVRLVLDHFNQCFSKTLLSTKQQSINEHMVKYKGHSILKQCVEGKPIQWGFKLWCRCAAKTGYLYEFDLYTGKKIGHTEHRLGEGVVLSSTEKILGSHCEIFLDNSFNSPQLQLNLLQRNLFDANSLAAQSKF